MLYIVLTFFMVLNRLYSIINHKQEYNIRKKIYDLKKIFGRENEAVGKLSLGLIRNYYGNYFMLIFVIAIDFIWMISGFFISVMTNLHVGMFVVNMLAAAITKRYFINYYLVLVIKLLYLMMYISYGLYYINPNFFEL